MAFGDIRPKLITKKEITGTFLHSGLYSKLKSGDMNTRLNSRELETFKGILSGYMDSEKAKGSSKYYGGINAEETEQIIQQVKQHSDFGPKKAAHIEQHLRNFLDKRVI
jgi:hypothetical protein